MKVLQLRMEDYQRKGLDRIAKDRQRSLNFLICEGIDLLLLRHDAKIPESRKKLIDK